MSGNGTGISRKALVAGLIALAASAVGVLLMSWLHDASGTFPADHAWPDEPREANRSAPAPEVLKPDSLADLVEASDVIVVAVAKAPPPVFHASGYDGKGDYGSRARHANPDATRVPVPPAGSEDYVLAVSEVLVHDGLMYDPHPPTFRSADGKDAFEAAITTTPHLYFLVRDADSGAYGPALGNCSRVSLGGDEPMCNLSWLQRLDAATGTSQRHVVGLVGDVISELHELPAATPGGPTPTDLLPSMYMSTVHYLGRAITDTHRSADVVAEVRVASIGEGRLHVSREDPTGTKDGRFLHVYRPVVLDVIRGIAGVEAEATGYVSALSGGSTDRVVETVTPAMELEEGDTGLAFFMLADGTDALAVLSPTHPTNAFLESLADSLSSPGEQYEVAEILEFYRYEDGLAVNAMNGATMPREELISMLKRLGGSD